MKSITELRFKITGFSLDLIEVAKLCRKARNVAIENWLLRQRGLPETIRQRTKCGELDPEKSKTEGTKLYDAICEGVPELGTSIAAKIGNDVVSYLSSKIDWRRDGTDQEERSTRGDLILSYDDRPPYFTSLQIPIQNKNATAHLSEGVATVSVTNVLRGVSPLTLELSLRGMPPGKLKILHQICQNERKLQDSKVLFKGSDWYWIVPVQFEREPLDSDVELSLRPVIPSVDGALERFFVTESEGMKRPWAIGDGRYLLRQTMRIHAQIKERGWRYRNGIGTGHGRKKHDQAIRRCYDKLGNHVAEVRRKAILDICRQAERQNAGTVIYREPTNPAKAKCWFAQSELNWDWTKFKDDLKNTLHRKGIELKIKKLHMGEILKWQK